MNQRQENIRAGSPRPPQASPQFLEAAQHVAHAVGLDVDRVVRGNVIEYEGMAFWLHHHGTLDSTGIILVVEMGRLAPGEDQALRSALQYNFAMPGNAGHYAMLADGETLVYCLRIDSEQDSNPAQKILSFITIMAAQKDGIAAALDEEWAKRKLQSAACGAAPVDMQEGESSKT